MAVDLDDLEGSPRDFAAQLKGFFSRQLPAARPPASEHLTHGARENQQLAEIIGQLQHVLDLADQRIGRPRYLPLIVALDGLTATTEMLPAEAHTLAAVQVSTDTAAILTLTLNDPHAPGGARQIARVVCPVGVTAPIPLDVAVPPSGCTLGIAASAAPAHASLHILLQPQLPGGYPYAG